jgi:presenilin-like A22 family membrane protease
MKHRLKTTLILLEMFLLTQFIGLFVIASYNSHGLPEAFESNEVSLLSIIPSFIFAILLILFLMKYKQKIIMRIWFTLVVIIALYLTINSIFLSTNLKLGYLAFILATGLAFLKVFKPTNKIHNITEVLIYPGVAAVFVPILGIFSVLFLLILISIYDMWAVWHSGIMQKMAKYQMEEVGIFGGFLIPSLTKKQKEEIREYKLQKTKNLKKLKKMKVQLAMLGGGDVIFPIITAGVFMTIFNSIIPALFIIFGALAGLTYLLSVSEKKKFYPAMPFISGGIFISLAIWYLISLI